MVEHRTTITGSKKSIKERILLFAKTPKMIEITVIAVVIALAIAIVCTFTGDKKVPKDAALSSDLVELTAEELAYFNNELFNGEDYNIHNQFLSSLYDVPEDIDLFELFYCGTGQQENISDAERKAVGDFDENGEEICPTSKLSISAVDAVLTENMRLTLDKTNQIGLEYFDYRKEYGAYYHTHGDTNYRATVDFSAGVRQGDLISLFYDDGFIGDGAKMVTLRETEDGGYQFVSNRYNAALPVSAAVKPAEKPMLTVPIDSLALHGSAQVVTEPFCRQDWGELVTSFWYQGAGAEPDRSILVGVWPDGGIYACYVDYENTAGEDIYRRFAQLCTSESTQFIIENPDWVSITPFTDLFGYDGFTLTADGLSRYYVFKADGTLNLFYSSYGSLNQLFMAGDDCVYAFDDAGRTENPTMLIQKKGGELYRAELGDLMTRLTPELFYLWMEAPSADGVAIIHYSNDAQQRIPNCTCRVCCDGNDLRFY